MIKQGFVLLFFRVWGECPYLVPSIVHFNLYIESVFFCIGGSLFMEAVVAGLVTATARPGSVPDASSSSITSL